ncbi:BT4734/BF3469 family protein [Larkinella bovis]|uniref:BT4734/BF3469 family protein n=1 Tax=Larkinella bovis TaxID=683041 RepID=A0ABW0I6J2_9BACT
MITWLKSPKWYSEQLRIRALKATNEKAYQYEKVNTLPASTMSGEFEYREASGLIKHSGFICLDIDRKDNPHLTNFYELKEQFPKIKNVAYCGWSLSGEGYFILIPIAEVDRHSEYFEFFRAMFGKWGVMIDKKCGDVSRLRIYSHDPEAYFNHQAEVVRLPPLRPKPEPKRSEFKAKADDSNSTRQKVEQVIEKICRQNIDITAYDGRWFRVALALIDEFGEGGREYFHAVSQFHPEYNYAECDRKYSYFLKKARGQVRIGTFFSICREFGIVYEHPVGTQASIQTVPTQTYSMWDNLPIEYVPVSFEAMADYPKGWDVTDQKPTFRLVVSPRRAEIAAAFNLSEETLPLFSFESIPDQLEQNLSLT